MPSIVLFDDDMHALSATRALVEEHLPQGLSFDILEATSLDELKAIIATGTHVDILISDIIMPDSPLSGIQVVQQLFPPESGTQVIYTSGHLEQATEVYATNHLYFLLKPVDPHKLHDALEKACIAFGRRQPAMLRIKSGHQEHLINISTIVYLESVLHKAIVHTRTQTYETYAKLDDLHAQLPSSFSRCHRSFVVNLACVSSLKEDAVHLHDGTVLPVSRRRSRQVQHDLLAYLSHGSVSHA